MDGNFFNNLLSRMQGVQGPPTPEGKLPTIPLTGTGSGIDSMQKSGMMDLMGPVLEGLMAEPKQQQTMPSAPAPSLGRGGQVQPVALPQFNPGSIAQRLRGQM